MLETELRNDFLLEDFIDQRKSFEYKKKKISELFRECNRVTDRKKMQTYIFLKLKSEPKLEKNEKNNH